MLHWKGMSAQSWVSGVYIFVVGRDIVRELRKTAGLGTMSEKGKLYPPVGELLQGRGLRWA